MLGYANEAATGDVSWKKLFLKISQFAGMKDCNFIKKENPTQVVSSEYCEIFTNTYFEEHLETANSVGISNNEDFHCFTIIVK